MSNLKQAATDIKAALDKIEQSQSNPQLLAQAIVDAKAKVAKICDSADDEAEAQDEDDTEEKDPA